MERSEQSGMRLCPACGGSGHKLLPCIKFAPCEPCNGHGTIVPAPPYAAHLTVTARQLQVAGNANDKRHRKSG